MSQILSVDELKYYLIEKHSYALVKAIEKFRHFIMGKCTEVKVPLPAIKFLLSHAYLSGKLAHLQRFDNHDILIQSMDEI